MDSVPIVGAGLAGSEAAFQLACRGVPVTLIEMRPGAMTGAHRTANAAEIVCSNSFKSTLPDTASGLLKAELDLLGNRLLGFARAARVPAGHALAVDRDLFAQSVTSALESEPKIDFVRRRQENLDLPLPAIIATGPLTDQSLAEVLQRHCSSENLYFYDAIAPSIDGDTIGRAETFWASRYGKGTPDYLNIPLAKEDYLRLLENILKAECVEPHPVEEERYFEACLPIEILAKRGEDTLRFGPLRPRGLPDPRTGSEPYAVVQLRKESRTGTLMGLVGFQTRMKWSSQTEIIRSIPGLERAKILRYGSIHRNMFLDTPRICNPYQHDRKAEGLFYAGQICGVEGYVECIMSGLVSALSVFSILRKRCLPAFPKATLIGSLMSYLHTSCENFQPMNANIGLLPAPQGARRRRKLRNQILFKTALSLMRNYRESNAWLFDTQS